MVHQGMMLCSMALMARTAARTVPASSASRPMSTPGWSKKLTSGRWNVSQRSTKVSIFCDERSVMAPP